MDPFITPRRLAKSLSRHLAIDVDRKTIEIRERQSEFPSEIRKTIEALRIETNPSVFVGTIEDSLLSMIEGTIQNQRGIPCTEAELEVAIRFFPNALWYPLEHIRVSLGFKHNIYNPKYIIHFVPFVPIFAKLGIESGGYAEKERGGMTTFYWETHRWGRQELNMLQNICSLSAGERDKATSEEDHRRKNLFVDKVCLAAIVRLRELGIFEKADIIKYNLIGHITRKHWEDTNHQRFRYLYDWCPEAALAKIKDEDGSQGDEDEQEVVEPKESANKRLRCK